MINLVKFRKDLHQNPEVGFNVTRTSKMVVKTLLDHGLEVTTEIGKTGVVATLNGENILDPIMLRADMDALPISEQNSFAHKSRVTGTFHGCGHDGHTTMLLGAALKMSQENKVRRTVHFLFQPNEENGLGAIEMVKDGLFERFPTKSIYGLHNMPNMPIGHFASQPGLFCAFEDNFEIRISGLGGHSSSPEICIDPIVIGSTLVNNLQTIVSRSISPKTHATLSVTNFKTDGARNVLASNVIITGDCRGYENSTSKILKERIIQTARGLRIASGAKIHVSYKQSFPTLSNDEICHNLSMRAAQKVGSIEKAFGRVGFSEDFAQFLKFFPGSFILMGNGLLGSNAKPLHNPNYDFNDEAIQYGVSYWQRLVEETS